MSNHVTEPTHVHALPRIRRGEDAAMLATGAYERLFAVLDRLGDDDWSRPTDCAAWTVADIVGHLVGAARGHASLREFLRQARHGRAHADEFDGSSLDAMNDLQVRDHAHLAPDDLLTLLRQLAPRAVRKRTELPRPLRRLPVPLPDSGSMPQGLPSSITLGHLNDVILTRDVFLHRIDIAIAADLDPELDDGDDRRVVADVVAEWAERHGQPVRLRLLGSGGVDVRQFEGGPTLEVGVVDFLRAVSGRQPADGLLATPVLF